MLQKSDFQFFLSGRKGKKLNSGEDSELCLAWQIAGYKLWYDPAITFTHEIPAGRLEWKYFRKLFRAFGRSDIVTLQYMKALGKFSRKRTIILDNYFLYIGYLVFRILIHLPMYLFSLFFDRPGKKIVLFTERDFAMLVELAIHPEKYQKVKQAVSNAEWLNKIEVPITHNTIEPK
jgi:hypothetical protein